MPSWQQSPWDEEGFPFGFDALRDPGLQRKLQELIDQGLIAPETLRAMFRKGGLRAASRESPPPTIEREGDSIVTGDCRIWKKQDGTTKEVGRLATDDTVCDLHGNAYVLVNNRVVKITILDEDDVAVTADRKIWRRQNGAVTYAGERLQKSAQLHDVKGGVYSVNRNNQVVYIPPEKIKQFTSTLLKMLVVLVLGIGGLWWYSNYQTRLKTTAEVAERTRDQVAHEAGFASYVELKESLTGPLLHFWDGKSLHEQNDGYLISESYIPLRAIAGRPNVTLFQSYEAVSPSGTTGVVGTMKVWHPYFVFQRKDKGILIGETLRTPENERRWAPIGICFCWTTRECLNLDKEVPTYRTLEEAKAGGAGGSGVPYRYAYKEHFVTDPSRKDVASFQIAALPVLDRKESVYWCVAKPEGDAKGYETCWIKWDGKDDAVTVRLRTTRVEFERYLNGILRLEREFRELNRGLLGKGLDYLTAADLSERTEVSQLRKRLEAVPKLPGHMERLPESMEEYQQLKKKALRLLEVSSSPELWDCNEVAYLALAMVD